MLVTAAAFAAAGVNEVFDYNRKSYKFDREQQIGREVLRLQMQIKRFELFREDIRDLVKLTVDRMDIYHVVGALFLQFCVVILTKGRIQAASPPFLLSLFLLTAACAFIYLLLAVWMSVHASIASHSFGTKLLTRFVRLPIPSQQQIRNLTFNLKEFEQQRIGDILRLPFQKGGSAKPQGKTSPEAWQDARRRQKELDMEVEASLAQRVDDEGEAEEGEELSGEAATAVEAAVAAFEDDVEPHAAPSGVPLPKYDEAVPLLPDEDVEPIMGGDDLLAGKSGARPDRHVQLFRILQAKWQCYDAYCRVCMSLGVNQMLQVLSYYSIAHTVVENQSPSTGIALVFMFQCCTVALGVFDLAGLKRREIIAVQLIGVLPCILTVLGVARGTRNSKGELDPEENYTLSPFSFLLTVIWLELWLRISSPSRDRSRLPRRFRQVLFLDVFGDAGADPCVAEDRQVREGLLSCGSAAEEEDDLERTTAAVAEEAIDRVCRQHAIAQAGLRRWLAVPSGVISRQQRRELEMLVERLRTWGTTVRVEQDRCRSKLPSMKPEACLPDEDLQPWGALSAEDRAADPFAGCLVGPFAQGGEVHYDVEASRTVPAAGAAAARRDVVLTLPACVAMLRELEQDARRLLEVRILFDLKCETRRQRCSREAGSGLSSFPNLVALVNDTQSLRLRRTPTGDSQKSAAVPPPPPPPPPPPQHATRAPARAAASRDMSKPPEPADPAFDAVAGKDARHFVPERLPWELVSRMTRVLQICWSWAFLMALLKELSIFKIDFGIGEGLTLSEGQPGGAIPADVLENGIRRLCVAEAWHFERLAVAQAPAFFRPHGLACADSASDEVVITTPFAVHAAAGSEGDAAWSLREIARTRMSNATTAICTPTSSECWLAAPQLGGLALRHVGRGESRSVTLPFHGARWRLASGAVAPCARLARLLPSASAPLCLLLAGYDGASFPVVALPLPEASEAAPPQASLAPALAVPSSGAREPVALHVDAARLRLWAVWADGELEAWDLLRSQSLGRWRPQWGARGAAPIDIAVCGGRPAVFALLRGAPPPGAGRADRAVVLRAALPDRLARADSWATERG